MRRVVKFLKLPLVDQLLLVEAGLAVVIARTSLWVLPFRVMRPAIGHDQIARELPEHAAPNCAMQVARVTWAVSKVSRFVPEATCLTQALSTRQLLRRRGIDCTLRLGVKRDAAGAFRAHAWIEHGGHIVIGNQEGMGDYAPLPAF